MTFSRKNYYQMKVQYIHYSKRKFQSLLFSYNCYYCVTVHETMFTFGAAAKNSLCQFYSDPVLLLPCIYYQAGS